MKPTIVIPCPYCETKKEIPAYIQDYYIRLLGVRSVYCNECSHPIDVSSIVQNGVLLEH